MTIILGCYTDSFGVLKDREAALAFGWWSLSPEDYIAAKEIQNPYVDDPIIDDVCTAAFIAERIVFDLTHIYFPFNVGVITLRELWIVMNYEILFNKTQFYVNGKEVNKDKLKSLFFKDEPVKLIELQELFI